MSYSTRLATYVSKRRGCADADSCGYGISCRSAEYVTGIRVITSADNNLITLAHAVHVMWTTGNKWNQIRANHPSKKS